MRAALWKNLTHANDNPVEKLHREGRKVREEKAIID